MSGYGSAYAGYDAAYSYGSSATSYFSVTFTVDELTDFTLRGNIDSMFGDVSVSLSSVSENIFSAGYNGGITDFNLNGQFMAGEIYELTLFSFGSLVAWDGAYWLGWHR